VKRQKAMRKIWWSNRNFWWRRSFFNWA